MYSFDDILGFKLQKMHIIFHILIVFHGVSCLNQQKMPFDVQHTIKNSLQCATYDELLGLNTKRRTCNIRHICRAALQCMTFDEPLGNRARKSLVTFSTFVGFEVASGVYT